MARCSRTSSHLRLLDLLGRRACAYGRASGCPWPRTPQSRQPPRVEAMSLPGQDLPHAMCGQSAQPPTTLKLTPPRRPCPSASKQLSPSVRPATTMAMTATTAATSTQTTSRTAVPFHRALLCLQRLGHDCYVLHLLDAEFSVGQQ